MILKFTCCNYLVWNKFSVLFLTYFHSSSSSCYANAVLQCLAFSPPLTAYFLQGLHSKTCMLLIVCNLLTIHVNLLYIYVSIAVCNSFIFFLFSGVKKEWCFACEFESLILKVKEGKSPLSPIGILSQLQNGGSQLGNGREEDAHEFLRCAILLL